MSAQASLLQRVHDARQPLKHWRRRRQWKYKQAK